MVEIVIMLIFGIVGFIMRKTGFEGAPLILAFILSPMMENAFKQSMLMSQGSFTVFFARPIALVFMVVAIVSIITAVLPILKGQIIFIKDKIESEE
jgi:putative tricarboxylic transport membrane protein